MPNLLDIGNRFEGELLESLRSDYPAWSFAPFGQALLPDGFRKALRDGVPVSAMRWFPDLCAWRADQTMFLDAKTATKARADSPNYSVQIASVEYNREFAVQWQRPIWFVFPNRTAASPGELLANAFRRVEDTRGSTGSGTPYLLVAKDTVTRTLDDIFA